MTVAPPTCNAQILNLVTSAGGTRLDMIDLDLKIAADGPAWGDEVD
jgi:hypothetical protein